MTCLLNNNGLSASLLGPLLKPSQSCQVIVHVIVLSHALPLPFTSSTLVCLPIYQYAMILPTLSGVFSAIHTCMHILHAHIFQMCDILCNTFKEKLLPKCSFTPFCFVGNTDISRAVNYHIKCQLKHLSLLRQHRC